MMAGSTTLKLKLVKGESRVGQKTRATVIAIENVLNAKGSTGTSPSASRQINCRTQDRRRRRRVSEPDEISSATKDGHVNLKTTTDAIDGCNILNLVTEATSAMGVQTKSGTVK